MCLLQDHIHVAVLFQALLKNMFVWIGNKNLHEPLLHNSKRVSRDSSPQVDSKPPPSNQLAFFITT